MPNQYPPHDPAGSPQEDASMASALEALRLNAEFGVDVTHGNLPKAVQMDWMRRLREVESSVCAVRQISLFSFLGQPSFPSIGSATAKGSEQHLAQAIERVLAFYAERGVSIECPHAIPDRAFYRYLTEELIWEPVPEIRLEGISHHFVYEGFQPNDAFDIEHTVAEFFDMLFGGYFAMLESVFYVPSGELVDHPSRVALIDRLCDFAESFDLLVLNDFQMEGISFPQENEAILKGRLHFSGFPNLGQEGLDFQGPVCFRMHLDRYGYWAIEELEMPGVCALEEGGSSTMP
jgi:hypothetical protein